MKTKIFKPAKVKFSPMPVKEEETILHYLDGRYIGPWKAWFDKKFSEFLVIERNYRELTKNLWNSAYYQVHTQYKQIDHECLEAVRLAYPYLHREVKQEA